ncbi:hypothetical protein BO83DRAFT_411707 [Aspergillus eucalypticola CBS 122712]|uniref:Uncharacterized protein n=1 Tax=Aspergillus eucalypticola (strain CBS 122712 / IBT 29274) TaxID=1448314 RepID=A0A317URP4_ASPEC|nr:uncharacterized protein BO83DRAFT_411707 [Aspergillus eucalypticola CBS 122712]PWY63768.1 hypothetical protein BO83DRAFT_411707 [Aspergillus eucalypticola CBS 122712]
MLFTHISTFCPQFPYPTVWRKRTLSGHQAQTGPPPKKWGFLLTHFPFSCMPSELSCPPPPIPAERIPGEEALDTPSLPDSHTDFPPSNSTIFSACCGAWLIHFASFQSIGPLSLNDCSSATARQAWAAYWPARLRFLAYPKGTACTFNSGNLPFV